LEKTEEAPATRDSKCHAPKLSEHLVPFFQRDPVQAMELVEDRTESLIPVCRKGKDAQNRIEDPAE
jgi:hypothetical protein